MKTLTETSAWVTVTVPEITDPFGPSLFEITFQQLTNKIKYVYDLATGGGLPAGATGQVMQYIEGWQGMNSVYLPAGATRFFSVQSSLEDGNGFDVVFAGGEATGDGDGGNAILRAGLLAATITEPANGKAQLQTADEGVVCSVSGTAAAPKFGAFNVTEVARPSIDRGTATWMDIAEALHDLGWIELTADWP
jgi:hypothetical protein